MTYQLLGSSIPRQAAPAAAAPAAAATPAATAPAPALAPRQRWTHKPLSADQRSTIGRLGSQAYKAEAERGIVTVPATGKDAAAQQWRHEEYFKVTGHHDLDACHQGHFRGLCAHFRALIGTPAAAARSFRDSMRTGRVKSSGDANDTHEAREMWRNLINQELDELGWKPGYAYVICEQKFKCKLNAATAATLEKVFYQIRSNAQAKRKKGELPPPGTPSPRLKIIKPGDLDEMPDIPF
jgi:hypothetical protein